MPLLNNRNAWRKQRNGIAFLKPQIYNRGTEMTLPDNTKDYYSILGAGDNATPREIEQLYRRKARERHPDHGGNEEEMKTLNEAYGVLKDEAVRREYDMNRQTAHSSSSSLPNRDFAPHASRSVELDAVTHRVGTAILFIVVGLVLLFLVRFQYVFFLWPLALLAAFMIFVGVVQAHSVMTVVRGRYDLAHPIRRFTFVQEALFWCFVIGGGYGVYLLLTAD